MQDAVAKSRSKSLDLSLDSIAHVDVGSVRHVTISPKRVRAPRRARRIEQARLRNEHERFLRVLSDPRRRFRRNDLVERTAEVERTRFRARGVAPRHRCTQRPIHFAHAGTVVIPLECIAIAAGEAVARDLQRPSRRNVQQHTLGVWDVAQCRDWRISHDLAPYRPQIRRQRIRYALRATSGDRPTGTMSDCREHQANGGGGRVRERHDRVRAKPRKKTASRLSVKSAPRERACAAKCVETESPQQERVTRNVKRRQRVRGERIPVIDEWTNELAVGDGILTKRGTCRFDVRAQHSGRTIVERMCHRRRRLDPAKPVLVERQGAEKRHRNGQRMHGRADIVREAWQRQLGRPCTATDSRLCFEHEHRSPRLREDDRRGESVGASSHDHRVIAVTMRHWCALVTMTENGATDVASGSRELRSEEVARAGPTACSSDRVRRDLTAPARAIGERRSVVYSLH